MVDKTVRMNMLFDFYGPLLTERQRRFFEMYYAEDLSLGEIAEGSGVSRQAVYDIIKRSASALENFERRLGLLARYQRQQARLAEIREVLTRLQAAIAACAGLSDEERTRLEEYGARLAALVQGLEAAEE